MQKVLLILLFQFTINFICVAQSYDVEGFSNYSVADGLPSSEVFHSIVDSKGQLWFATGNGVSMFNGDEFQNFGLSEGLPNSVVMRLYLQKDGRIVGECKNSSYFVITKKNEIIPFKINEDIGRIISDSYFSHSYIELSKEKILIGSKQGSYTFKTNKLESADSISHSGKEELKYRVFDDHVFTYRNRCKVGQENDSFLIKNMDIGSTIQLPLSRGMEVYQSSYGVRINDFTVAITFGSNVYVLENGTLKQQLKFEYSAIGVFYSNNTLRVCLKYGGIISYKLKGDAFILSDHIFKTQTITSFTENNNTQWYTTANNGVFKKIVTDSKIIFPLDNSDRPSSLFIDKKINIVGTQNGIYYYNHSKESLPKQSKIFKIKRVKDELLFFASRVYRLNSTGQTQMTQALSNSLGFYNQHPISDSTFIATTTNRVQIVNESFEVLRSLECFPIDGRIEDAVFFKNQVYVTSANNFYQIDWEKDQLLQSIECEGLIVSIEEWAGKVILVCENGSVYFVGKSKVYESELPKVNGLSRYTCATSIGATLITGSNNGIYAWKFNRLTNEIESLVGFEKVLDVTQITSFKDDIYFTCTAGLRSKNIKDFHNVIPKTLMRSISLNDSLLDKRKEYSFSHNENNLSFTLGNISTEVPLTTYRYQMIGLDKSVIYSNNPKVNYSGLSPGRYTFVYSGSCDDYNYSKEKRIVIIIDFPFWRKTWFIALVGLIVIICVTILFMYRSRKIKIKLELHHKITKLRSLALSAQLNPHLIFNVLNSIQGIVSEGEIEKANTYIARFSKFMRTSLNLSKQVKVDIQKEIDITAKYIDLERLRFEDSIVLSIEYENFDSEIKVPPLIIQPFIENAIKHGVMPSEKSTKEVYVKIVTSNSKLIISIIDNGVGFSDSFENSIGDGLRISIERLKTINNANEVKLIRRKNPTEIQLIISE